MDYSKTISAARYECVVCHLKSVTIAELHRHQTFRHTTEELSLSTIGLRSSLNYGAIGTENGAFARSWLCEPQKRSAFYAYSSVLLGHENNAVFDRSVPLDCVVDKKDFHAELDVDSSGRPSDGRPQKIPHWRSSQQRPKRARASNNGALDLSRPRKYAKKKPSSLDGDRKFLETKSVPEPAAGTVSKKKSPESGRKCKTTSIRRTVKFEDQAKKGGKERKEEKEKVRDKTAGRKYRRSECQDGRGQSREKERKREKEEKDRAVKDDRKNSKKRRNSKLLIRRKGSRSEKTIPNSRHGCDEIAAETEKAARGSKKKRSSRRKKRSSHRVSPKTSTRVRKLPTESENEEELSWTGNNEISHYGEVCVDRASLDVAEDSPLFQDVADTTGLEIHPQNLVPDVAQEVCVGDTWTDTSPVNDDETSRPATEHFGTVESFPPYPGDMDERTILVLDPTTCKLVWSSFELLDDSISAISDESLQNTNSVYLLESDSLVRHNYVVSDDTRSSRSSWKALRQEDDTSTGNEAQEPQLETNGSTLTNEENGSPRSSRLRSTGPRLLLETFKQENTSSPPRRQEPRRNKKLLENEGNSPNPSASSHGSKRSASSSRSFLKSNEKRNKLKRSMCEQPQAESNTLAGDENFIQTIFSQRSKRNRTVTSRYVPH